jgi:hypothetical protein
VGRLANFGTDIPRIREVNKITMDVTSRDLLNEQPPLLNNRGKIGKAGAFMSVE